METKNITLIEPNLSGHHLVYLDYFINALLNLDCHITVYSLSGVRKIEGVMYKTISYKPSYILPQNSIWKKIMVCFNFLIISYNILKLRVSIPRNANVFFCCVDDYQHEFITKKFFEVIFPFQFSGLLLAPRDRKVFFSFDRRNMLRSKFCRSIGVLDEFCFSQLMKFQPNILHFPDFSDEAEPNLQSTLITLIKKKSRGRKIVSLLGAISSRKGIRTFIQTVELMDNDIYFFLIAGQSYLGSDEEKCMLDNFSRKENCMFYNNSIPSESDFNALFCISNVIFAAYVNFQQSSNMFAKSALFKKPIIVSKGSYMEECMDKYHLGISIDQHSPQECAIGIKSLTRDKTLFSPLSEEYLKYNSYTNLKYSFLMVLNNFNYLK